MIQFTRNRLLKNMSMVKRYLVDYLAEEGSPMNRSARELYECIEADRKLLEAFKNA